MNFYAVIIGTEILNGRRVDKHFDFLKNELKKREFELFASFVINDNKNLIKNVFKLIKNDSNSVMFSFGGIGATPDDMTREVAGEVFSGGVLQIHQEGRQIIENKFKQDAYPNRINLVNFYSRIKRNFLFFPFFDFPPEAFL